MTSTIKVNTIQNTCGADIIKESSNTITIGASGDTVTLASGASQSGFGREGSVNWQTSSIKTATFTATSGEGYFCNTSGGAFTVNLPAGSAGAIVSVSDYTRTFNSNNLTVSPNGSEKIGGVAADVSLAVNGQAATFVYVDSTEGWINVQNAEDTETGIPPYISATGGTITECGNCRIHTFTGPGTFTVERIATASPAPANNQVSYMVVAGGGGGGAAHGGGGGAGGFREDKSPITPYTASPLDGAPAITVTATSFPITVGAGGAATPDGSGQGNSGSPSVFSTITSTGGGGGGGETTPSPETGLPGGSGGGQGTCGGGIGNGNTPPVSPPQGNNGGTAQHSSPGYGAGGGGGATAVGSNGTSTQGGAGGAGATTGINGSNTAFAGGGGGSTYGGSNPGGAGGAGGGGNGAKQGGPVGTAGTANTGGGGGGGERSVPDTSGLAGGSGIVIIRYKFQ